MDSEPQHSEKGDSEFVWDDQSQLYFHARFCTPSPEFLTMPVMNESMNDYSVRFNRFASTSV